jgi:hypothetical protein
MKAKGLDREAIVEKIYPKSVKGKFNQSVSIPAGKKFSKRIEGLLPKK